MIDLKKSIRLLRVALSLLLTVTLTASICTACTVSEKRTTNLEWKNTGNEEGDADGPAYVVYSKKGYNKASAVIDLSKLQANLKRKSDGKTVNAYLFLGINVYGRNGEWKNCADAGLCLSGTGKWHAFANRYSCADADNWWESGVSLDAKRKYRLVLDSSQKDESFTLSVCDMAAENKPADEKTFTLYYTKRNGSNTSYYQDYAIDFPDAVKKNPKGQYTGDFEQVVAYNTDENLYMKNINISEATLYQGSKSFLWSASRTFDRFMWPDKFSTIKYPCTVIRAVQRDSGCVIDLDMNKH